MEITTPLDCAPALVGPLPRRNSRAAEIRWGDRVVHVGGDAPVCVQSMTNTDTSDAIGTAIQVKELARAGSELVRITVDTPAAAAAVPAIREQLDRMGVDVPLVGDFHYNGHKLLQDYPECAQALSKYRISPGNVGQGAKRDTQFAQMIEIACRYDKPVRIGVNWGSLDQDLLARIMDEELSYLNEARATDDFRRTLKGRKHVYSPRVYFEYTTDRVLVMEFIEGLPASVLIKAIEMNDQEALDRFERLGIDRKKLARRFYGAILEQIYEHDICHTDPHPGNLILMPKNRICFIDFGADVSTTSGTFTVTFDSAGIATVTVS